MEVTDDITAAEVVAIYFLNLDRVLIIDRRRNRQESPLIKVYPQEEFLLEGNEIQAPLTPEVVHSIERHHQMPAQPEIMESYLHQLADLIAWRAMLLRPGLSSPRLLSLGPHFGPVLVLAHSPLWQALLDSFRAEGDMTSVRRAQSEMRALFAFELQNPERVDAQHLIGLKESFWQPGEFQVYARPKTETNSDLI